MYISILICIHTYIQVSLHNTYVHKYILILPIYIAKYIHSYKYVCISVHKYTCAHACLPMYMYIYAYVSMDVCNMCMYVHTLNMHTHKDVMYVCLFTCLHVYIPIAYVHTPYIHICYSNIFMLP